MIRKIAMMLPLFVFISFPAFGGGDIHAGLESQPGCGSYDSDGDSLYEYSLNEGIASSRELIVSGEGDGFSGNLPILGDHYELNATTGDYTHSFAPNVYYADNVKVSTQAKMTKKNNGLPNFYTGKIWVRLYNSSNNNSVTAPTLTVSINSGRYKKTFSKLSTSSLIIEFPEPYSSPAEASMSAIPDHIGSTMDVTYKVSFFRQSPFAQCPTYTFKRRYTF